MQDGAVAAEGGGQVYFFLVQRVVFVVGGVDGEGEVVVHLLRDGGFEHE